MATFNATITASADDARQNAGTVTLTGTNITIEATNQYGGLRFQNVTIPNASTISAATLTVDVNALTYDDPDVDIWGEDTDDAAAFTTASNNISGRTATTAVVQWTASSVGTGAEVSPDISSIIQEIVNRAGWASGNDLALILKGRSTNPFRFNAYDSGAGAFAVLDVTYTAPGSGQPMQVRGRMVPGMRRPHGYQGW